VSGLTPFLYAKGAKIYGLYNCTNSPPIDVMECFALHNGVKSPPVQHLLNKWDYLIATHGFREKFLETCHSGGADILKNALLASPKSVQQRIIALAINPSVIIPNELCFRSYNYVSRRDFVTRLDILGNLKYGSEVIVLEPHPNAKLHDHEFSSPTFDDIKEFHINDYLKNYGGEK